MQIGKKSDAYKVVREHFFSPQNLHELTIIRTFTKVWRTVQIEVFLVARKILAYIEVGEFFETT